MTREAGHDAGKVSATNGEGLISNGRPSPSIMAQKAFCGNLTGEGPGLQIRPSPRVPGTFPNWEEIPDQVGDDSKKDPESSLRGGRRGGARGPAHGGLCCRGPWAGCVGADAALTVSQSQAGMTSRAGAVASWRAERKLVFRQTCPENHFRPPAGRCRASGCPQATARPFCNRVAAAARYLCVRKVKNTQYGTHARTSSRARA